MFEILEYPFMQRALISGLILGGVLAVLGTYVLLRRMAFFSDGIAHASLAGIAVGLVFSWHPLIVALFFNIIFALIIYFLEKKFGLSFDIAIGILFTSGMSLGVLLITLQPGYQPDLFSFLFGNILSVQTSEVWIIGILSFFIFLFILRFFRGLTLLSLDEELAYVSGVKVKILQPLFYVVLSVTVLLGIKILGVILVSALLILPTASARILATSFKKFLLFAIYISEFIILLGIFLSFSFDLPTGPIIVLVGTFVFSCCLSWQSLAKKNL